VPKPQQPRRGAPRSPFHEVPCPRRCARESRCPPKGVRQVGQLDAVPPDHECASVAFAFVDNGFLDNAGLSFRPCGLRHREDRSEVVVNSCVADSTAVRAKNGDPRDVDGLALPLTV
jgi:hypothetical protein